MSRLMNSLEQLLITGNIKGQMKLYDTEGRIKLMYSCNGKVWMLIVFTTEGDMEYQASSDLLLSGDLPTDLEETLKSIKSR